MISHCLFKSKTYNGNIDTTGVYRRFSTEFPRAVMPVITTMAMNPRIMLYSTALPPYSSLQNSWMDVAMISLPSPVGQFKSRGVP